MYSNPYIPITDIQIRKIYAQPTRKEQIDMQYKIHDEMMFFMEGISKGIFIWSNLPMVFLSEEEEKRVKGISIDQIVAYLCNLKEGKRSEFKLKRITVDPKDQKWKTNHLSH